jgi:hypothetical protein
MLQNFLPTMNRNAKILNSIISEKYVNKEEFEILQITAAFTLDVLLGMQITLSKKENYKF